jgi:hypothetical protein
MIVALRFGQAQIAPCGRDDIRAMLTNQHHPARTRLIFDHWREMRGFCCNSSGGHMPESPFIDL